MKFSYRHPAMIRGIPPRCRTVRNAVVWMDGQVDVPEFTPDDIPIACEIDSAIRHDVFRYHDGNFYKRGDHTSQLGDRLDGLVPFDITTRMVSHIQCEIATRWHDHRPLLKELVWPRRELSVIAENESIMAEGGFTATTPVMHPVGDARLSDLAEPLDEDVEYFRSEARKLAEGVICIDGWLWTPTAEPVLFMVPRTGNPFSLRDMSDMRMPTRVSVNQPAPYGEAHHMDTQIGDWWNWKAFALSVNEHRTVSEIMFMMAREGSLGKKSSDRMIPEISVHVPELFGKGIDEMELVRVAKGLCAHIFTTLKGDSLELRTGKTWKDVTPPAIRKLVTKVANNTYEKFADIDLLGLEADLQGLAKAIRDNGRAIQPLDQQYQNRMRDMPARIDTLIDRFDNRTINMPEVIATHGMRFSK
jgi:hypothetical protein